MKKLTIDYIRKTYKKFPNTQNCTLISNIYINSKTPLIWKFITSHGVIYNKICWNNFRNGLRAPKQIYHYSINDIRKRYKKLPKTKNIILVSNHYIRSDKFLWWALITHKGQLKYFRCTWDHFKEGQRYPKAIKWNITKIKAVVYIHNPHLHLLSKYYYNDKSLLKWKLISDDLIRYGQISWSNMIKSNYRIPKIRHWTTWVIKKTLPNLKHSHGYSIFNKHIKSRKQRLNWRYIDNNNKIHYFNMTWRDFYNHKERFQNVSFNNMDIIQEIYDAVGNNFTVLYISIQKDEPYIKLLIQHNSPICNYSKQWVNAYGFLTRHKDKHIKYCKFCHGMLNKSSKNHILHRVYNQWDNHNKKYIPDLSNNPKSKDNIKWKKVNNDNSTITFYMSIDDFISGSRPDNRGSRNERYFYYLIKNFTALTRGKDYVHSFKITLKRQNHHQGKKRHMSFDFCIFNHALRSNKINKLMIELNGIQHTRPIKWSPNLNKRRINKLFKYQQIRDARKTRYCYKHLDLLLWIPCYYISPLKNRVIDGSFKQIRNVIKYQFFNIFLPLIDKNYILNRTCKSKFIQSYFIL